MKNAKEFLLSYARYNVWANKRIAAILDQLGDAILDQEVISSFSSIRKTVFHVWDAEFIWLMRLQGKSLSKGPTSELPPGTHPSAGFVAGSEAMLSFIETQPEEFFAQPNTYRNLRGEEFTSFHYEMIMHCMNHSTFHRGQLVTLIRETGWTEKLPSTDMIAYFREQ